MDNNDLISQSKFLSDEVLRKIGRNVLLFQHIEGLLKFLIVNHRADGTTADFAERQQQRADKIQKQMMGNLVELYTDGILSDAGEPVQDSKEVTQAWVSTTFTISGDSNFYESQRTNMKLMVDERNDLIHHFLPRWRPDSIEHLKAATAYLDHQHEKILPMADHLKGVAKAMQESRQKMALFFASEEGERQLELLWLQVSPLVTLLRNVAIEKARTDGWTYLALAGQLARTHERDAVEHMKERYGHSTLRQILVASELFDVLDEPLASGGFRTLYRVK